MKSRHYWGAGNPDWEENDLEEARDLHHRMLREVESVVEADKEDMGRPPDEFWFDAMIERAGHRSGRGGI